MSIATQFDQSKIEVDLGTARARWPDHSYWYVASTREGNNVGGSAKSTRLFAIPNSENFVREFDHPLSGSPVRLLPRGVEVELDGLRRTLPEVAVLAERLSGLKGGLVASTWNDSDQGALLPKDLPGKDLIGALSEGADAAHRPLFL